jgi:hypothetical protein
MKTFLIVLHLFAADGTSTDVPMDNWVFASQDACAESIAFINKGQNVMKRLYACQVVSPNDPALAAMERPVSVKKKS